MTFFVKRERGEPFVAQVREELEQLGRLGLWRETTRRYFSDYGFVQSEKESFAETMARALGINTDELRICIAENRIGSALLERFSKPENTTDICDLTGTFWVKSFAGKITSLTLRLLRRDLIR